MKATFNIKKGFRQDNTIPPRLFTNCLEYIFRDIDWDNKGINVNGETSHHLKFADDIILISANLKDAETMLNDLHRECTQMWPKEMMEEWGT